MNRKVIISGMIAGIIVFVWGMLSWMVLPWHTATVHDFGNEMVVSKAISAATLESGVYSIPSMKDQDKDYDGPIVFVSVKKEKVLKMPWCMIGGLVIQMLAGIFLAWILSLSKIEGFKERLHIICKVVFFAVIVCVIPDWYWWGFSTGYSLVMIADLLIGWGIAGIFLAKQKF